MGHRPPKAIGQFAWRDADIGVECLRCGLVAVFCDWEAEARFRERGWSTALEDAVMRFRCRCGSRDVRVTPVTIGHRPRPIPVRPAALRPIYIESRRSLFRRAPHPLPAEVEDALEKVRRAVDGERGDITAAIELLRPYCYNPTYLTRIVEVLGTSDMHALTTARQAFNVLVRQLGRS